MGTRLGNWAVIHKVRQRANTYVWLEQNTQIGLLGGEVAELERIQPASAAVNLDSVITYVDDRAGMGTDTRGGDYTPVTPWGGGYIPPGEAPHAYDLMGNTLTNDGADYRGAIAKT